jgi:hypothetical protein
MQTFGKCNGGGRRSASRAPVPLAAILTTITGSRCVALVDISCTGARLQASELPAPGEDLDMKIEAVRIFATVIWSSKGQCGIVFDSPLMPFEVDRLQHGATAANLHGLSIEERQARDDWLLGITR